MTNLDAAEKSDRQKMRERLIRAANGGFGEWYSACFEAQLQGWTQEEILHVLRWYHISTWVFLGIAAFTFAIIIYGHFTQ